MKRHTLQFKGDTFVPKTHNLLFLAHPCVHWLNKTANKCQVERCYKIKIVVLKFIAAKNSNVVSTKLGETWWWCCKRNRHLNFSEEDTDRTDPHLWPPIIWGCVWFLTDTPGSRDAEEWCLVDWVKARACLSANISLEPGSRDAIY